MQKSHGSQELGPATFTSTTTSMRGQRPCARVGVVVARAHHKARHVAITAQFTRQKAEREPRARLRCIRRNRKIASPSPISTRFLLASPTAASFSMATEAAQAEVPAPPSPIATGVSPQKRVLPVPGEGGEEEHPQEPKRRRACVAALDGVTCAATAASEPDSGVCDASFSFQHAGGGFVALETTPKFGSFNPPAAAEQAGLDVKPAPPDGDALLEADEQVAASSSGSGAEEDGCKEGKSHSQSAGVEAGGGQGHHTVKNDDPVSTC